MRLAVGADGMLVLGPGSGRGAYLCPDAACVDAALRTGALPRRLRAAVTVPEGLPELVLTALPGGRKPLD